MSQKFTGYEIKINGHSEHIAHRIEEARELWAIKMATDLVLGCKTTEFVETHWACLAQDDELYRASLRRLKREIQEKQLLGKPKLASEVKDAAGSEVSLETALQFLAYAEDIYRANGEYVKGETQTDPLTEEDKQMRKKMASDTVEYVGQYVRDNFDQVVTKGQQGETVALESRVLDLNTIPFQCVMEAMHAAQKVIQSRGDCIKGERMGAPLNEEQKRVRYQMAQGIFSVARGFVADKRGVGVSSHGATSTAGNRRIPLRHQRLYGMKVRANVN